MIDLDARLAGAQQVANTVLYEGYVLYPYRASAGKNQMRWTFGLLAPEQHVVADPGELSSLRTEIVVHGRAGAVVHIRVRFLQIQRRTVWGPDGPVAAAESAGEVWTSFEEALEHAVDVPVMAGDDAVRDFVVDGGRDEEPVAAGVRLVRERQSVRGRISARIEPVPGEDLWRIGVDVANITAWSCPGAPRDEVCTRSLAAVHTLLAVDNGRFLSVLDPPDFAVQAVSACRSRGTFPVLITDDVVLSSPITLYDRPAIAPESEGDMFDSTEIDEILALRVLTLTDEEKREARATDPRAAAIIDRCDAMTPDAFARRCMARSGRPMQW